MLKMIKHNERRAKELRKEFEDMVKRWIRKQ